MSPHATIGTVFRAAALLFLIAALVGLAFLAHAPSVRQAVGTGGELLMSGDLTGFRDYLRGFGIWAPVVSVGLMQVQALIAPLPSFPIMYANGLLFGTVWGGLLSWASILLSAILCFGLARLFGRPLVERVVSPPALAWADRQLTRFGAIALFFGRLLPLTSFDLLSYAAGLTPMRLAPFCVATGIGMLPAVFLVAAAGDAGWRSPWAFVVGVLAILALAGLLLLARPLVVRWLAGAAVEPSRGR
jgi:uncharacterized membrane protein YdjX (TVP38/TMEM64 family)